MTDRKPTLGEDLRDTLHAHGILGPIMGCEADAFEITVCRAMLGTDDQVLLTIADDGELDVVRVYETFDMNVVRRR